MESISAAASPSRSDPALRLPPDWRLERDAPCPVCRYNLRGLHDPRCPECGSSFRWQEIFHATCARCGESLSGCDGDNCPNCKLPLDWPALLDSARVIRRGMYEYTNRPLGAALRTMFAVLIPALFWRGFVLEMPPNLARLSKYRRWVLGIGILGLILIPAIRMSQAITWQALLLPLFPEHGLIILALAIGMPLLVSLALPRFTPTLAQFRIRSEQLTRCLTYLASSAGWLGLIAFVAVLWNIADVAVWWRRIPIVNRPPFWLYVGFEPLGEMPTLLDHARRWIPRRNLGPQTLVNMALLASMIWSFAFEYVALRFYLHLKHRDAFALTLSTQVVAFLALACAYTLVALALLIVYFD